MFTLRAATPKDVDILASIEAQSFPEAEMATRESFEKRLAVFPDCFLILFEDGEPVGLIDGMITNNRTISDDMFEMPVCMCPTAGGSRFRACSDPFEAPSGLRFNPDACFY